MVTFASLSSCQSFVSAELTLNFDFGGRIKSSRYDVLSAVEIQKKQNKTKVSTFETS